MPLLQDFYMGFGDMLAWQTAISHSQRKEFRSTDLKVQWEKTCQLAEVRRQDGDRSAQDLIPFTNSELEICPEIILKEKGQEKLDYVIKFDNYTITG